MSQKWFRRKKRVFQIIEVGYDLDFMSRAYDFINVFAILLNVLVSVLYTFEDIKAQYASWLTAIEIITICFFAIDYFL